MKMRVGFLGMVAACALWAGVASAQTGLTIPKVNANYEAMDKLGWKIAIQAWTFNRYNLFDTIDICKAMGVRYLEMYPGQRISKEIDAGVTENMTDEQLAAVQKKFQEAGIQPVCFGVTGVPGDEAGARKLFAWARKLGLINIVCEASESQFGMLDKLTDEYQINIALHNHPRESHYWSPDIVLAGIKGHSNRIGSCSDTGHWVRSGLIPFEALQRLKGHIISLHFKDLNELRSEAHDVPWGTGKSEAKAMLAELKRQNFKGVFSIEYEYGSGQELVDNVAKCVQFFSDTATELAR